MSTTPKEMAYKAILNRVGSGEEINYQEIFFAACAEYPVEMAHVINKIQTAWHAEAEGLTYIETIKLARERTGMGLRDAKLYVDEHFAEKRNRS